MREVYSYNSNQINTTQTYPSTQSVKEFIKTYYYKKYLQTLDKEVCWQKDINALNERLAMFKVNLLGIAR